MSGRGTRFALAAIMLAAAAWSAPTAGAGERLRLIEAGGATFPERAFVLMLPGKRSLSAADVQVRENGDRVGGVSVVPAASAAAEPTGVVLVIDASDSMRGKPIRNAIAAARAFAERRPPNQRMGIVAFNRRATVLLPLTSDADVIADSLSKPPTLANGTHVYDAIRAAVTLLEESDVALGTVIVLSDGADTGSTTSAAEAADAARDAHIRVFTVGIRSAQFTSGPLRKLGAETSGAYAEARSPDDLARIYDALGAQLANEYLLKYRSNARPSATVRVAVRVTGTSGLAVTGYEVPPAPEVEAGPYRESALARFVRSPLTMLAVILVAAGLFGFALLALLRPRRRTLRTRMAEFVSIRTVAADAEAGQGRLTSRVLTGAERSLETRRWWTRFKESLELAEIRMPAVQIALWTVVATLFIAWFMTVIGGSIVFGLAGLAVPFGVRSLIFRKLERRRKQFAEQLPDNLQVLASAIRAGHSFVGALSVVVDDADEPSKGEFRRIVADEQLGVPLEDAIRTVVRRMNNDDLEQVALVASLQRRTGGNMAEVLERVTDTIRERFELRRMVQTLTAQGRMSRWIVSALPVVLLAVISALNPAYVDPLFTTTGGRGLLVFAAVMVVSGSLVIKRIVNIKV